MNMTLHSADVVIATAALMKLACNYKRYEIALAIVLTYFAGVVVYNNLSS